MKETAPSTKFVKFPILNSSSFELTSLENFEALFSAILWANSFNV